MLHSNGRPRFGDEELVFRYEQCVKGSPNYVNSINKVAEDLLKKAGVLTKETTGLAHKWSEKAKAVPFS